jgi:hypothetical protein
MSRPRNDLAHLMTPLAGIVGTARIARLTGCAVGTMRTQRWLRGIPAPALGRKRGGLPPRPEDRAEAAIKAATSAKLVTDYGWTLAECGRAWGVSRQRVHQWLSSLGVRAPRRGPRRDRPLRGLVMKAGKMLLPLGAEIKEVAYLIGCHQVTASWWLKGVLPGSASGPRQRTITACETAVWMRLAGAKWADINEAMGVTNAANLALHFRRQHPQELASRRYAERFPPGSKRLVVRS